jgi:hypothetical protein
MKFAADRADGRYHRVDASLTRMPPIMSRLCAAVRRLPKSLQILLAEFGVTVGLIFAVYYVLMSIRAH